MEIHFKIIGVLFIGLSALHIGLPKYFNWRKELAPLSLMNRQMMHIHTFFIAFMVLLMGILCLTCAEDLTQTPFGKIISLGLGIFWGTRFFFQFFAYSPKLWRGKTFETLMHILFSLLWAYLSTVFLATYFI